MSSQNLPLVCEYIIERGHKPGKSATNLPKLCGKEPVKFFKNLRRGVYCGFCEEHASQYPDGWAAFKPVSKEEAVAHEVMDS